MDIFRRVHDLSLSYEFLDGNPLAVVKMPEPEKTPCAHFVAVALLTKQNTWEGVDRENPEARIFTLEFTVEQMIGHSYRAVFCEWTKDGNHVNLGRLVRPEKETLVSLVGADLQKT